MGIPFESLRLENTPLFGNVIALFFFAEFLRCFPVDCIVGCLFVRAGTFSELDMVFWVMNGKALEIFGYHDGVTNSRGSDHWLEKRGATSVSPSSSSLCQLNHSIMSKSNC